MEGKGDKSGKSRKRIKPEQVTDVDVPGRSEEEPPKKVQKKKKRDASRQTKFRDEDPEDVWKFHTALDAAVSVQSFRFY